MVKHSDRDKELNLERGGESSLIINVISQKPKQLSPI
ncbi:hypothetical protein SPLC1_S031800 [Arthrospira platensis C1]|nr:hypothetical protein SPLC1_S031800 [Arthrospira platensis C1]